MERNLEYFSMLIQEKNITKASQKLYISQPFLSKFLKLLEDDLGVPLFYRRHNELHITEYGKIYYEYLINQEKLRQNLINDIAELKKCKKGTIILGITPWLGSFLTSQIMEDLSKKDLNIELRIIENSGFQLMESFFLNKIDLLICVENKKMIHKEIGYQNLISDKMLLVVSKKILSDLDLKGNSLYSPAKFFPKNIKEQCIITGKEDQVISHIIDEFVKKNNLTPKKYIRTQNINNFLRLIDSGQGISFIPTLYIKYGIPISNCYFFDLDDPILNYNRNVYYFFNKKTNEFNDMIKILKKICKSWISSDFIHEDKQ